MRTETLNIYKFNELLSERAKERAREHGRQLVGENEVWDTESLESVKAFCEAFGVRLAGWSIGAYSPIEFSTNVANKHFRKRKLRDFNRDNMPTGYCLDCDLWRTFYDEFKKTGDAKTAFNDALYAGFKAWRDDIEGQLEDDYIDEWMTVNEFEFYENGDLH
jgi:hypothetical protein